MLKESSDPACTNSIGYTMNAIRVGGSATSTIEAIFFSITVLNPSTVAQLFKGMVALVLFAFLFYYFAEMLSDFAADLTGGPSLGGMAINPNAVTNAVGKMAKAYAQYKLGDKKGAAKTIGIDVEAAGKARPDGKNPGITAATSGPAAGVSATKADK
jgi:type IV secretion system protein VirB6